MTVEFLQVLRERIRSIIEEDLHLALCFRHPQQILRLNFLAKIRRVFDFGARNVQHFADAIDYDAHQYGGVARFHLGDDYAGSLGIFRGRNAEFEAQIDDGNHFAPQIDHSLDVRRRLRHRGDILNAHDFADLQNANSEFLAGKMEGQIFACARIALRRRGGFLG